VKSLSSILALVIAGLLVCPAFAADRDGKKPRGRIGVHLQTRAAFTPAADDPTTTDDESTADPERSFTVRRARLRGGWKSELWRANVLVAVEHSDVRVLNAYLTLRPRKWLRVTAGQFKRQVSLDYLISSSAQRIYERSLVGNAIDSKRDIGAMVYARALRKRLQARLCVLNGNGPGTTGNDNSHLRFEGRIDGHLGKRINPEKRRIGRKPGVMLSAAYATSQITDRSTNDKGQLLAEFSTRQSWSAGITAQGWRHELRAEWIARSTAPIDARADNTIAWPDVLNTSRDGGFVQWAWLLPLPVDLEVSARGQLYRPKGDDTKKRVGADLGAAWMPTRHLRLSLHGWRIDQTMTDDSTMTGYGVVSQLQVRL